VVQVLSILLFWVTIFGSASNDPCACLPPEIQRGEVVSTERKLNSKMLSKVTVEQQLKQIKARCRRGKLVDDHGCQIYFYRLQGCWGNPPADYQEILTHQSRELEKLRKKYHVIEMTCNPSGDVIS